MITILNVIVLLVALLFCGVLGSVIIEDIKSLLNDEEV